MASGERIYLRSTLSRVLYDRIKRDEELKTMDTSQVSSYVNLIEQMSMNLVIDMSL